MREGGPKAGPPSEFGSDPAGVDRGLLHAANVREVEESLVRLVVDPGLRFHALWGSGQLERLAATSRAGRFTSTIVAVDPWHRTTSLCG